MEQEFLESLKSKKFKKQRQSSKKKQRKTQIFFNDKHNKERRASKKSSKSVDHIRHFEDHIRDETFQLITSKKSTYLSSVEGKTLEIKNEFGCSSNCCCDMITISFHTDQNRIIVQTQKLKNMVFVDDHIEIFYEKDFNIFYEKYKFYITLEDTSCVAGKILQSICKRIYS